MAQRLVLAAAVIVAVGYVWLRGGFVGFTSGQSPAGPNGAELAAAVDLQKATFAGGCFWCVEADFDKLPGVVSTTSGYTGGHVADPSYQQVSRGGTGHTEAVEIVFDSTVVSYEQLLDYYWRNVDPFVAHRQFCDVGSQYRPEIFVHSLEQRAAAESSKARVQEQFEERVVVRVTDASIFYLAESYHQDYHRTHALQYRFYRWSCGRDSRLQEIWGST